MNKRHYEHTLPNIRGSLSNTYAVIIVSVILIELKILHYGPDGTYMRQIARHDPGQVCQNILPVPFITG